MNAKSYDWKEVANDQFAKALALAVVLVLFGIMIAPKFEVATVSYVPGEIIVVPTQVDTPDKIKPDDITPPEAKVVIDELQAEGASDVEGLELVMKQMEKDIKLITRQPTREELPNGFEVSEQEPVPIRLVRPEYPVFARENRITGVVELSVEVYKDGSVGNIVVTKSVLASLDAAAVNAVKQWTFQPGKSGGHAVNTIVKIPLEFSLTDK